MALFDFLKITKRETTNAVFVEPKFNICRRSDLMTKGGDFCAVWMEDKNLWSTDEVDVINAVDRELSDYLEKHEDEIREKYEKPVIAQYMWDSDSKSIDKFHKYCQKQVRDNFHQLDSRLIFSNDEVTKEDYATKTLPYPLKAGDFSAWDQLVGTLYTPPERRKIEWAIGAIVSGESVNIQKFMVFYGSAGTGKSTILNVIQKLFKGYYATFDAKALGSANASFALEPFKENPLIAIQHDGKLNRIEDNTRINSLVSHEEMTVNEKFKSAYTNRFNAFLMIGTNEPVKITDAKSGIIRRLIDVTPSGVKLATREYNKLVKQIDFELGAIAQHCLDIYNEDPHYYDDYIPVSMIAATNDFYNFVEDSYLTFSKEDGTTLKAAWEMYKAYCDDAKVSFVMPKRIFREELSNYFREQKERYQLDDGTRVRNYFVGFRKDKFDIQEIPRVEISKKEKEELEGWLIFKEQDSKLDTYFKGHFAQYAKRDESPAKSWDEVTTRLSDIDSRRLHYVWPNGSPIICVDFDLKDENGNKDPEKNLKAAKDFPPTYGELSKGGGVHLIYIYNGDISQLAHVIRPGIELKTFPGKATMRRKLSLCNDLDISAISSGLPLKEKKQVIDDNVIKNENHLRALIVKALKKEVHPNTKPNIDFIKMKLDQAYESGMHYDVSDIAPNVMAFAAQSNHQADYCLGQYVNMKFQSEDETGNIEPSRDDIFDLSDLVMFDIEIKPNKLIVCWHEYDRPDIPVHVMIDPTPTELEVLFQKKLVGFNNIRYDNPMLYARYIGYDIPALYELSNEIIGGKKLGPAFRNAKNISHSDIYDFSTDKKSLKKFEIELGIPHKEFPEEWDKPISDEKLQELIEYCKNDVLATEAVFKARMGDYIARLIQVEIVKQMHGIQTSPNESTNNLSGLIIFGSNRYPHSAFNWRDLSKPVGSDQYEEYLEKFGSDYNFRVFDSEGLPLYRDYIPGEKLPEGYSILPFFPGYTHRYWDRNSEKELRSVLRNAGEDEKLELEKYHSIYLGQLIGEGGRVYAEPGLYRNVLDEDVTSMHPHTLWAERVLGPVYSRVFYDIVRARVAIKKAFKAHKKNPDSEPDFSEAESLFNGVLKPFLSIDQAENLAQALKIVINSIYGLTSAHYDNIFRDPNNIDNLVAKRGALFMTLLKDQVEKRGFKVAHIKTDSIKVPEATPDIHMFICNFGKEYGYNFEIEAEFDKFCLVNDSVYIAKEKDGKWTATGKQFQIPYVFKTLFSKEPIVFEDLCVANQVKTCLYLDFNEELQDDAPYLKELKKLKKIEEKLGPLAVDQEHKNKLEELISKGHAYRFIGKVGLFTPIKKGYGGGDLVRKSETKTGEIKYDSVQGAKGYRWQESEIVKNMPEDVIDYGYFNKLADEAIETIQKFGDYEELID